MKAFSGRPGGLAITLGALLWIALRYFVTFSWNNQMLGLDYRGWNSLMPIPLLLLLLGAIGLYARLGEAVGLLGRAGLIVTAVGLVGSATGVVVEFWWAGGLAGNRTGAHLGWATYLASYAVLLTLGLWLFGIALFRSGRTRAWGVVPLLMGVASLSCPPVIAAGNDWQSLWVQGSFALGWVLLAPLLWTDRHPQHRHSRVMAD